MDANYQQDILVGLDYEPPQVVYAAGGSAGGYVKKSRSRKGVGTKKMVIGSTGLAYLPT